MAGQVGPPVASAADEQLATREGKRQFWIATTSSWLGTTMEYVDFALYGLATALVFNVLFFPSESPALSLLAGFATYAVGFVARPLGAVFFGRLGDRYGRRVVLVVTVAMMGGATTLIGLLPTHAQIGALAPILLLVLRLVQGFGAGAELSGAAIILAEYAPARRRGLIASIVALGSNSGTLIASGVWLAVLQLPEDALFSWGWRIPFVASILITLLALVIRHQMQETPVFRAAAEKASTGAEAAGAASTGAEAAPAVRTSVPAGSFWGRNKAFFVMLGLRIGENGPSYMAQGFLVGYVAQALLVDNQVPTRAVLIASFLGFLVIPFSGWMSDRFGRRIVYRWFCAILVVIAIPMFALLDSRDPIVVTVVIVLAMCVASLGIFGAQAAYGVELFGVRNRFTKMALGKELGSILSGGTAPAVASGLLAAVGAWWPLAVYWMLMAGIGLVTTFFAPETRARDLTLEHDATEDAKASPAAKTRAAAHGLGD